MGAILQILETLDMLLTQVVTIAFAIFDIGVVAFDLAMYAQII